MAKKKYKYTDPENRVNRFNNYKYTEEQKKEAIDIYIKEGAQKASEVTGIPYSHVTRLANSKGIYRTGRKLKAKDIKKLIDLRKNKGLTYQQLAYKLDISPSSARNYVKAFVEKEDRGLYQRKAPNILTPDEVE